MPRSIELHTEDLEKGAGEAARVHFIRRGQCAVNVEDEQIHGDSLLNLYHVENKRETKASSTPKRRPIGSQGRGAVLRLFQPRAGSSDSLQDQAHFVVYYGTTR
jgi:hypothetical protein